MTIWIAILLQAGPLEGLPSKPGAHAEKVKALGENAWLELGAPAADPKWGRARGRSWTSEMPFAPELRGAFLYGEGVHGYAKPDGRYMDDLWFYDVPGHRWICVYPGADTKSLSLKIDADGFEADGEGRRIPVAQQVHGYEMNTYDPDLRRFMSMPNTHGYEKKHLAMRDAWAKPAPADASPWFYETKEGRWNRLRTGTNAPKSGFGDTLIYIPSMKKAFFAQRSSDVWFYDAKENKWSHADPPGPKPPFGIDAVSCYDPKRERIYIGGGSYPVAPKETHALRIYDLKANAWVDPKPKGAPVQGSNSYPTKNAIFIYEPASDKVILVMHTAGDDKAERIGIYVYDPEANAWSDERLEVDPKLAKDRRPKNGFYDPEQGVIYLHTAGDSNDDGTIWVYRPKRK
jgi:hypothetical protein